VYTNQRLNLSKPWEGSRRTCQGFKPASGNPTGRHYRGASRNVRHGETVNPPAIERAGTETPHLQRGALDFYPDVLEGLARACGRNGLGGRQPEGGRGCAQPRTFDGSVLARSMDHNGERRGKARHRS